MSKIFNSKQSWSSGVGILTLFAVWSVVFGISRAATIDELKQSIQARESEIGKIEAEIEAYQKQIDENISKADTLKGEIKRLETVLKKLNADLRLTQKKISASELSLEKLSMEINATNRDIASKEKALAAALRA
ncbi:hypothetical protein HY406_00365, partial [Candidatus Giovannonibacteria bacterium]|nr:hypothetical protein [Candidatus Giovannonibacteria bacterium]